MSRYNHNLSLSGLMLYDCKLLPTAEFPTDDLFPMEVKLDDRVAFILYPRAAPA
jgi:hypothetical protein